MRGCYRYGKEVRGKQEGGRLAPELWQRWATMYPLPVLHQLPRYWEIKGARFKLKSRLDQRDNKELRNRAMVRVK